MQPPDFWYNQRGSLLSALLAPAGWLYGLAGAIRQDRARPWQAPIPIVCVGNLVAGGQGKTPTALSIGTALKAKGKNIQFLSRGYGGALTGPLLVDPASHTAQDVGDEPLLLADIAPTWVSVDRRAGVEAVHSMGAEIIVMDDGFQNPAVKKDLSIIVIDGEIGFGNGRLIPAGPLREGVAVGLSRAQAVVIIGEDRFKLHDALIEIAQSSNQPPVDIFSAKLKPDSAAAALKDQKVYAFAGIGRPKKFFNTVLEIGADLVGAKSFDDHHPYTENEINTLLATAKQEDATLVTTAKDHVRLSAALKKDVAIVTVTLDWTDASALDSLLKAFV